MSEGLRQRLITATLLIGGFLAALYLAPPTVWTALALLLVAGGAWEWAGLMGLPHRTRLAYMATTVFAGILLTWQHIEQYFMAYLPAVLFWCVIVPVWLKRGWTRPNAWLGAITGWMLLLTALLAMVFLRATSPNLMLACVALAAVADSAAYFAGRAFGRHKLAPAISPGKTWEGALGGALAVMAYGALLVLMQGTNCDAGCLVKVLIAFAVLFVLSVEGDLFESWIKRRAGVKDSGNLLPGHGGILDRIDSHLAVLPAAALFWIILR